MSDSASFNFIPTIGGQQLPITGFDITSGVFGSVGHMVATTSIQMLAIQKIDLFTVTANAAGPVETTVDVSTPNQQDQRIFGGEFVSSEWDYDRDLVTIHCRDWAGQLVDQKRILTKLATSVTQILAPLVPGSSAKPSGVNNINAKLSQIVQQIAQEFNMTPVLNLEGAVPDVTIGALYGSADSSYLALPQSLWGILNQLARDTGYDVYVTPNRQLVFGQGGVGIPPLKLSWMINPVPDGSIACGDLVIGHHPRRNATFRVMVFSHDPAKAQTTTGQAVVVGSNFSGSAGLKPGIWTGGDAATANKQLATAKPGGVSSAQVPLYSFRFEGLTQAQAESKAQAIATDIARRELILDCMIDGFAGATPTQKINIAGPINDAFAGNDFYMNSYHHRFRMPQAGEHHGGAGGFTTIIKALDIPTLGTGGGGPLL